MIALVVDEWPSEEQLSSTRLARQPSVDDALAAVYGTVQQPRLAPGEMQSGWSVEGQGLVYHGGYSRDPRPVARTSTQSSGLRPGRTRGAPGRLVAPRGHCAALLRAALWAAGIDADSDHIGEAAFILAFLVGFAVRWTRLRTTSSGSRTAGVVAALLTFLAVSVGMAGSTVRQLASQNDISLPQAAREIGELVGWHQTVRTWYRSPFDVVVLVLALSLAYGVGSSGSDGIARRSAREGS
jgi:hypothetical protein